MIPPQQTHAWAGTFPGLVTTSADILVERLTEFLPDSTAEQITAWREEVGVLQREGTQVIALHPPAAEHGAVLEYRLPREAGRRPDVVVLQNGRVVVVEFKQTGQLRHADVDQVAAYARDLRAYHSACGEVDVVPVLVLCGNGAIGRTLDGVRVVPARDLGHALVELARASDGEPPDLQAFLDGEYAPLPSLVAAARLLFDNLPLPHIKRARSAGVSEAVARILDQARDVHGSGGNRLVLVTGVPGAGKTLVGLQVAHAAALERGHTPGARRTRGSPATFLSGNGPLVQVLQHALKSTAFVQDMHRFIREYGLERPDRVPPERLIVFDEAQRAWDEVKLTDFYLEKLPWVDRSLLASEPALLARIAARMPEGALVLALVGQGQEIHAGEEAGMGQWADALAQWPGRWSVFGPPAEAQRFTRLGIPYASDPCLNLDTGLRYHAAADLHRWVELVLDAGDLDAARPLAARLRDAAFPIYVTRDLDAAKGYVRERFGREPLRRYGILASSKSARHLAPMGVDAGFQATKQVRIGEWFNAEPGHPRSSCQLTDPITEFQCQGLELDLAIVAWADDFVWDDGAWRSRAGRAPRMVRDPHRLRTNAYRVLLTRGREGLVIWVPPAPAAEMDRTANALLRAGAVEARSVALRAAG